MLVGSSTVNSCPFFSLSISSFLFYFIFSFFLSFHSFLFQKTTTFKKGRKHRQRTYIPSRQKTTPQYIFRGIAKISDYCGLYFDTGTYTARSNPRYLHAKVKLGTCLLISFSLHPSWRRLWFMMATTTTRCVWFDLNSGALKMHGSSRKRRGWQTDVDNEPWYELDLRRVGIDLIHWNSSIHSTCQVMLTCAVMVASHCTSKVLRVQSLAQMILHLYTLCQRIEGTYPPLRVMSHSDES